MSKLKYSPNGLIEINSNYSANYATFNKHCEQLDIENPIILGEYFQYIGGVLKLIDRVGNFFDAEQNTEKYDDILYLEQELVDLLNYVEPETPLIILIPQVRRDYENSIVTINNMDFLGDSSTRAALTETIKFLEELGIDAPESISWSAENGFFDLGLSELKSIALQIGTRRQKAFVAQKLTQLAISDGSVTNIEDAKTYFTTTISNL